MKILKYAGLVTLLLFVSCKGGEERVNKISDRVTKKLELSEAQIAKLTDLKSAIVKVQNEMAEKKKDRPLDSFLAQLSGSSFNAKEVVKKVEDDAKARVANTKEIASKIEAFHASLDDKQKEKLAGMVDKFKEKHEKKKQERMKKKLERESKDGKEKHREKRKES